MPVRRGQLLFTIDPDQLSTSMLAAEAELESARAQALEARNNYDRAVPLARINAISQSQLDQYTACLLYTSPGSPGRALLFADNIPSKFFFSRPKRCQQSRHESAACAVIA